MVHSLNQSAVQSESLSKGLSTPRRCNYCQKMVFFKAYRCKHCRYRCHKKCAAHSHRKSKSSSSSSSKSYTGEEHWTKVLQANEVNSNFMGLPCATSRHPLGPHMGHYDSATPTGHRVKTASASSRSPEVKDTNIFISLYDRFIQWVNNAKRTSGTSRASSKCSRSRSSSIHSRCSGHDLLQLEMALASENGEECKRCCHTSISSEDSDLSYMSRPYSSTCSSLTLTSTSTATSDYNQGLCSEAQMATTKAFITGHYNNIVNSNSFHYGMGKRTRNALSSSLPNGQSKMPSNPLDNRDKSSMCATWPPQGRKAYNGEGEDVPLQPDIEEEDLENSVFGDSCDRYVEDCDLGEDKAIRDTLGEFTISYSDLTFSECIRTGSRQDIHRGRWHGEVMIHTYNNMCDSEVTNFWEEVKKLSMIRHENVALFMGACIEPPNLAVITSVRKGCSLYESIHLKGEKTSMHSRVSYIRQVAQAMGYLHAKGVVLRKLNSKNIYLEPKVKLCLMDYGGAENKINSYRYDIGCIPRGNLTYVAPEMLKALQVKSPKLVTKTPYTNATDVYAFGTVLYEILGGQFPYKRSPPESLIWQVVKGRRPCLKHLRCNTTLKVMIEKCWLEDPATRPPFCDINNALQMHTALHKKHSSSEPETLNRSGLSKTLAAIL